MSAEIHIEMGTTRRLLTKVGLRYLSSKNVTMPLRLSSVNKSYHN